MYSNLHHKSLDSIFPSLERRISDAILKLSASQIKTNSAPRKEIKRCRSWVRQEMVAAADGRPSISRRRHCCLCIGHRLLLRRHRINENRSGHPKQKCNKEAVTIMSNPFHIHLVISQFITHLRRHVAKRPHEKSRSFWSHRFVNISSKHHIRIASRLIFPIIGWSLMGIRRRPSH